MMAEVIGNAIPGVATPGPPGPPRPPGQPGEPGAPGQDAANGNNGAPRFLSSDVGFFDPFYEGKSSDTGAGIKHAGKETYFRDFTMFIDRIKDVARIKGPELLFSRASWGATLSIYITFKNRLEMYIEISGYVRPTIHRLLHLWWWTLHQCRIMQPSQNSHLTLKRTWTTELVLIPRRRLGSSAWAMTHRPGLATVEIVGFSEQTASTTRFQIQTASTII